MSVQLYCFGESGNAYKAALALELSGVDWEPVFVDFFHGETRSEGFLKLNPMGEVPVLAAGDLTLSQSGAIQDWVVETTGKFAPATKDDAREVLRFVLYDNHKVSGQAGALRFLMNFLPEEKRNQDVINYLTGRLLAVLKGLNRHLEGRDWIVGTAPTMADLSCCGYLYYPEPFNFDRSAFANIDRWLDGIAALPGWKHPYDLMPGNPADRAPKRN